MKKFLSLIGLIIIFAAPKMHAQLVAAPVATPHSVPLTWTNTCSGISCTFNVYSCNGATSACALSAQVWTLLNASPVAGTSYTDARASLSSNSTYSYFVVAVSGSSTSGPSNEVQATIPLGPTPPVVATPSAT